MNRILKKQTKKKPFDIEKQHKQMYYHLYLSHFPNPGHSVEGLLQTRVTMTTASDWLVQGVGVTAGSGCSLGWLSRTCVQ